MSNQFKSEDKITMKINKKVLLATTFISLSMLTSMNIHAETPAADVVIATVNGDKIMKSSLDTYLTILKKSGRTDKQAAIEDLIATEIALQEATKANILDRPEIQKAISDFKRNVILKTWTKEKVKSFNIDDAAIKVAYDERVSKLSSKEYNARHILLKTEDEAKAVIKEIAGGADFAKVAKEKSTGPSGSNGGSLGWFKAQTMVPAFANAVKAMKKGDVSKAPVKTQFGFHVIKVEDSREAKLPDVAALKPQLERVIAQKKMLAYMSELKKTADIKITMPEEPAAKEKAKTEPK